MEVATQNKKFGICENPNCKHEYIETIAAFFKYMQDNDVILQTELSSDGLCAECEKRVNSGSGDAKTRKSYSINCLRQMLERFYLWRYKR